jgi:hypothetical protein
MIEHQIQELPQLTRLRQPYINQNSLIVLMELVEMQMDSLQQLIDIIQLVLGLLTMLTSAKSTASRIQIAKVSISLQAIVCVGFGQFLVMLEMVLLVQHAMSERRMIHTRVSNYLIEMVFLIYQPLESSRTSQ